MAYGMREANVRGERLGLSDDELTFYDASAPNDSAVRSWETNNFVGEPWVGVGNRLTGRTKPSGR